LPRLFGASNWRVPLLLRSTFPEPRPLRPSTELSHVFLPVNVCFIYGFFGVFLFSISRIKDYAILPSVVSGMSSVPIFFQPSNGAVRTTLMPDRRRQCTEDLPFAFSTPSVVVCCLRPPLDYGFPLRLESLFCDFFELLTYDMLRPPSSRIDIPSLSSRHSRCPDVARMSLMKPSTKRFAPLPYRSLV